MVTKLDLVQDWLPRYTGMPLNQFGEYVLLTNFRNYVTRFAEKFSCSVYGIDRPMQAATNTDGLTIINFGIGSPNAATVMDLLTAYNPKAVLFLGKCGGLKRSTEIGHFILPIGAIRGEGTSDDYLPKLVPALPSFKLHKFVSEKLVNRHLDYRTGVVYTTNRRVWEHDDDFRKQLIEYTPIAIDMETATIFAVGHKNQIARGALLLVSDLPMTPEGVKTQLSDIKVSQDWSDVHLEIGIESLSKIDEQGEQIKHFQY
jgi:AMP nucleosidase